MSWRLASPTFALFVVAAMAFGCAPADGDSDAMADPFSDDGKADDYSDRPYRIVPEGSAHELEPNGELLGQLLWFEPYTVDQDGNDIHVYRADDAWYEIVRYVVIIEEPGAFQVWTENASGLFVDIWRVHESGNAKVAEGRGWADFDVVEPGRYGVLIQASVFPVRTTEEEAYIEYDLLTAFEPAAEPAVEPGE